MVRDTELNPWTPALWSTSKENISVLLSKITIGILDHNSTETLRRTLECLTKGIQYQIPSFQRKKTAKLNLRQVLDLKRWYLMLFRY